MSLCVMVVGLSELSKIELPDLENRLSRLEGVMVRKRDPGAKDYLVPNTVDFSHHCVFLCQLPALGESPGSQDLRLKWCL